MDQAKIKTTVNTKTMEPRKRLVKTMVVKTTAPRKRSKRLLQKRLLQTSPRRWRRCREFSVEPMEVEYVKDSSDWSPAQRINMAIPERQKCPAAYEVRV